MALDEPKDDDNKYEVEGITWLIAPREEPFLKSGEGLKIDHVKNPYGSGFYVSRKRSSSMGCC